MTWNEIMKLFISILVSAGGTSVIVFALSNWLGKIWAKRINDEYKMKIDKEIEYYKSELEKTRNDYQRFSSKKFLIIEETWSAMNFITEELRIYNRNDGAYQDYLLKLINKINEYSKLINKNSLYFSDEIQLLLNNYVSASVDVVNIASEELEKQNDIYNKDEMQKLVKKIYEKASEREEVLKKIKLEFKKELGFNNK